MNDQWFGVPFFVLLFLLSATTAAGRARFPRAVLTTLLALGLAHAVVFVTWRAAPRLRPGHYFAEEQILRGPIARRTCGEHPEMWVERAYPPKSPSFPSSHAVTAGAAAAGLWTASRALGVVGTLFALLVGAARLYGGKHWPSDVLGAFAISAGAAVLAWRWAPAVRDALVATRRRLRPPRPSPP